MVLTSAKTRFLQLKELKINGDIVCSPTYVLRLSGDFEGGWRINPKFLQEIKNAIPHECISLEEIEICLLALERVTF